MPPRRHMRRVGDPNDVRFLTFSCHQRLALFNNARIRDAFAEHLESTRALQDVRVLAWVIMPEHVHLLLMPGTADVAVLLRQLKGPFARTVLEHWSRANAAILPRITDKNGHRRFWLRGGGYDRVIRTEDDLREKIDYIHANPVRRGLAASPTDWAWSSARTYEGVENRTVKVFREW